MLQTPEPTMHNLKSHVPDDLDDVLSQHYLSLGYVIGGDPLRCCFCNKLAQAHLPVYPQEVVPGEEVPSAIRENLETFILPFCFLCLEESREDLWFRAVHRVKEELVGML